MTLSVLVGVIRTVIGNRIAMCICIAYMIVPVAGCVVIIIIETEATVEINIPFPFLYTQSQSTIIFIACSSTQSNVAINTKFGILFCNDINDTCSTLGIIFCIWVCDHFYTFDAGSREALQCRCLV